MSVAQLQATRNYLCTVKWQSSCKLSSQVDWTQILFVNLFACIQVVLCPLLLLFKTNEKFFFFNNCIRNCSWGFFVVVEEWVSVYIEANNEGDGEKKKKRSVWCQWDILLWASWIFEIQCDLSLGVEEEERDYIYRVRYHGDIGWQWGASVSAYSLSGPCFIDLFSLELFLQIFSKLLCVPSSSLYYN